MVAARLEVAKVEYEERGRTDAALLLAQTEERVAELEARAKTETLKAVGRAYRKLRERPEIFETYTELYRLSQLDPSRIVSFDGFEEGALSTAALVESDLELKRPGQRPRQRPWVRQPPAARAPRVIAADRTTQAATARIRRDDRGGPAKT